MGLLLSDATGPHQTGRRPAAGQPPGNGPLDPQLELEVIWAARPHFDLPQTIRLLLSTLAALDAQGLRPQAVLIEDAANGPGCAANPQAQGAGPAAGPRPWQQGVRAY